MEPINHGQHQEYYNGFWIQIIPYQSNISFKVIEEIKPGKFKVRRHSAAEKHTGKRDQWGNKLYTTFKSPQDAIDKAKNYIDNHIVKWADSPNNPANAPKNSI